MLKAKRILAALLDYYILYFGIYKILIFFRWNVFDNSIDYNLFKNIVTCFTWSYFLFKDLLFKNASISKKILRLEIVDIDGNRPKFYIIILRNSINRLYPLIEVLDLVLILFCNLRISDIIFKTRVVNVKKEK